MKHTYTDDYDQIALEVIKINNKYTIAGLNQEDGLNLYHIFIKSLLLETQNKLRWTTMTK